MASMPLTIRLMTTCCSCTRSPSTAGSVGARSSRSDTRWPSASCCTSGITSLIAALMFSATIWVSVFLESARSRWMISLARLPLLITSSRASRASARSGTSRSSHRRPTSPLVTMAASGWLTSCAIEAVSSPKRRHARDMGEFRLRLLQGFLCAFAIFNVDDKPVPFQDVPLLIPQRHGTFKQPAIFTIGLATDPHLRLERLASRQRRIPFFHVLLDVVGVKWSLRTPSSNPTFRRGTSL